MYYFPTQIISTTLVFKNIKLLIQEEKKKKQKPNEKKKNKKKKPKHY